MNLVTLLDMLKWVQDYDDGSSSEESSTCKEPELQCYCGLPAKLRISKTHRNPYRLFYNCPKNKFDHQCGYFCWADELSVNVDLSRTEINFLHRQCIQLHKKVDYVQSQRGNDNLSREREKAELLTDVQGLQSELNDIKRRIQNLYESDKMPSFDDSCVTSENNDMESKTELSVNAFS